jgi:hypothetical protein
MKLTHEMEVHRGPDQAHASLYLLGDRGMRHPIVEQQLGTPNADGLEEQAFYAVAERLDALLSGDQAAEIAAPLTTVSPDPPDNEFLDDDEVLSGDQPTENAAPPMAASPVTAAGDFLYEVVATEADGTELRFDYTHHAREPLGVGDTFSLRHGALDLMSIYRVTRIVSDSTVEAEWIRGGGQRYPDEPPSS